MIVVWGAGKVRKWVRVERNEGCGGLIIQGLGGLARAVG